MKCIQCNIRRAQWKEVKSKDNAFCGRLCFMDYHFIGLEEYGDNIVGFETVDGTQIRITFAEAREMQMIDRLLENVGRNNYIQLPANIDGDTLKNIEKFFLSGSVEMRKMTDEQFMNLIATAQYLEFERLYMHIMSEWINNRPFPGPNAPKSLVPKALYFYNNTDFSKLKNVDEGLKKPFQRFIKEWGEDEWNIRFAAKNGKLAVVKQILLEKYPNRLTDVAKEAIVWAAREGHFPVVKLLIRKGAATPGMKTLAVSWAKKRGYSDIVKLLQNHGLI